MKSLRFDLFDFVREQYGVDPSFLWPGAHPDYAVLKHPLNRKWFAAVMDIPRSYLALDGEDVVDVLNVKSDPLLISALLEEPGYHPAWHMNKEHWLSVRLDGSISFDQVKGLLDMSYGLVAPRPRRRA